MKYCNEVYDKYKHFDNIFSDYELMKAHGKLETHYMWQAIKKDLLVKDKEGEVNE